MSVRDVDVDLPALLTAAGSEEVNCYVLLYGDEYRGNEVAFSLGAFELVYMGCFARKVVL